MNNSRKQQQTAVWEGAKLSLSIWVEDGIPKKQQVEFLIEKLIITVIISNII